MAKPPLSPAQASALLSSLVAEHGDGVLSSLLGAAFASDVAEAGDPEVLWDLGWFAGFCDEAFVVAAGGVAGQMRQDSCEL